jgi:uncharacterized membrane protein YeaQ/YmgE (transglycosylase-associated protein family)
LIQPWTFHLKEDWMLISIIGSLIVGLIVGALARLILPGRDPMGCLATALLGIAGSVVGGIVGHFVFRQGDEDGYFRPGFLLSLLGAILLLWLWRMIQKRR